MVHRFQEADTIPGPERAILRVKYVSTLYGTSISPTYLQYYDVIQILGDKPPCKT